MNFRRKLTAALAGVLVAPLLVVVMPTSPASAHGYVSSPASRQAQCARGQVSCGDIKYEPQSVEAPKGSTACNGGGSRFAELNNDGKGWKVASVGQTATFNWTFTARHRTANYEYFVNGRKVATFDGGNQQPPATVSHKVNLGAKGKLKVLARWNIGDTAMAFYSCIDVQAS
ncbi:lytic polysaccharide monooxygenase [Lentzea tibetensis]|uniref:Lytic polysaccharide monooxygenase n=1 Tax=Lentzea tibetensis TaxID=2591470 RepID=A0A563F2U9_9PSEU|nr:lytic polysaccharide monooxygenase auxiliary activity family 9 protein [Lentzea tibetensis]TWP54297.1 lytic polysaccharide monooxygenase [Lentzea tibetensis]